MRFFLDENFPKTADAVLVGEGHRVADIRGTADEGADDRDLFRMAQEREAVFLTTDRDFFHTLARVHPDHHGVVVIALRQPNRCDNLDRLVWFLRRFEGMALGGRAFLLRDRTWVAYPPVDE